MLGHMVLFRDMLNPKKREIPHDKAQAPFTPCEWAAFNRALYQRRPKVQTRTKAA